MTYSDWDTQLIDIYPTLKSFMGQAPPSNCDGLDIAKMTGNEKRKALVYYSRPDVFLEDLEVYEIKRASRFTDWEALFLEQIEIESPFTMDKSPD